MLLYKALAAGAVGLSGPCGSSRHVAMLEAGFGAEGGWRRNRRRRGRADPKGSWSPACSQDPMAAGGLCACRPLR